MLKNDKKSLEEMASNFSEQEISKLRSLIVKLSNRGFLSVSNKETNEDLNTLNIIGKLKMNSKIYAFHVDDEYTLSKDGVELWIRHGDSLNEYFRFDNRTSIYQVNDAVQFLKKEKVNKIYTGEIYNEFLGLPVSIDEDDPIINSILKDYEIDEFTREGIEVVKLDSLI